MTIKNQLTISDTTVEDIETIIELTKELGYTVTREEIKDKIKKFSNSLTEKVLIAEIDKIVGWMHVSLVEPLESKAFVEIRGIVVKEEYRKQGIGTKLIQAAEKWGKEKGCKKIRIRTNIKRNETRKYYSNLNYKSIKTQEVFEKEIDL